MVESLRLFFSDSKNVFDAHRNTLIKDKELIHYFRERQEVYPSNVVKEVGCSLLEPYKYSGAGLIIPVNIMTCIRTRSSNEVLTTYEPNQDKPFSFLFRSALYLEEGSQIYLLDDMLILSVFSFTKDLGVPSKVMRLAPFSLDGIVYTDYTLNVLMTVVIGDTDISDLTKTNIKVTWIDDLSSFKSSGLLKKLDEIAFPNLVVVKSR